MGNDPRSVESRFRRRQAYGGQVGATSRTCFPYRVSTQLPARAPPSGESAGSSCLAEQGPYPLPG
jgi:hypothetical protein